MLDQLPFREIWAVDFEFIAEPGSRPDPVCMVARELLSGRLVRLWQDDLRRVERPPFAVDENNLYVACFASAELGCHLALGWPLPTRILDLFTEFRNLTNGLPTYAGESLLGAMTAYGLDSMAAAEKRAMRDLVLSAGQQRQILDYCVEDVDALATLLPAMLAGILGRQSDASISLGQSLLRGRFMAAATHIEPAGIPIDMEKLSILREHCDSIRNQLIDEIDRDFAVYENGSFRIARFEQYLIDNGIAWPRLASGAMDLRDTAFRDIEASQPIIGALRELRNSLSKLRLNDLAVDLDGRNQTLLSPFRARTGRNQSSNAKFIFGPSAWVRSLIKPPPSHRLVYVDFASQEVAIAVALSGDEALMDAYSSGDVYLRFAKHVGLAPDDATKASHKQVRDRCKAVVLGVQCGMSANGMAVQIGITPAEARYLLDKHKQNFPLFWQWSGAAVDHAILRGRLDTVFGWCIHTGPETKLRSLMNFPMQANGGEMLRLACCLANEDGL